MSMPDMPDEDTMRSLYSHIANGPSDLIRMAQSISLAVKEVFPGGSCEKCQCDVCVTIRGVMTTLGIDISLPFRDLTRLDTHQKVVQCDYGDQPEHRRPGRS